VVAKASSFLVYEIVAILPRTIQRCRA